MRRFCAVVLALSGALALPGRAQQPRPGEIPRVEEIVFADTNEALTIEPRTAVRYPRDELRGHTGAGFAAIFVLDTTGHAEIATVSFTEGAKRSFYDAVCNHLMVSHFSVVRRDGIPRRALVIIPYTFSVDRGEWSNKFFSAEPLRLAIENEGFPELLLRLPQLPHCAP